MSSMFEPHCPDCGAEKMRAGHICLARPGLQTLYEGTTHQRIVLVQYGQVLHNPQSLCMKPMRGNVFCTMHKDHRGRHASVTYGCDGCSRRSRSQPVAYSRDGEYERGLQFCFMCASPQMADPYGLGHEPY